MPELTASDLDGTLHLVGTPIDCVISGRTFSEYDETCRRIAQKWPIYIRGTGEVGDRQAAGEFKAMMIESLGIRRFFEDDPLQADIIRLRNLGCLVEDVTT